jgi:hypothetical protein
MTAMAKRDDDRRHQMGLHRKEENSSAQTMRITDQER